MYDILAPPLQEGSKLLCDSTIEAVSAARYLKNLRNSPDTNAACSLVAGKSSEMSINFHFHWCDPAVTLSPLLHRRCCFSTVDLCLQCQDVKHSNMMELKCAAKEQQK